MPTPLLGNTSEELSVLAAQHGRPPFHGRQLAGWIYRRAAHTFDDMTDLPKEWRQRLAEDYEVGRANIVATRHSPDATLKLLLALNDGTTIETVGLPYDNRFSCCVSTQVGCPVGCVFCATGMGGFDRNLTAGEIVEQVIAVQEATRERAVSPSDDRFRIDHVTFMGMGEPLINYEATVKALSLLNAEMAIGARNLTVSTAGFVPGINRLAREKLQVTLAVSLHAPNDELRRRLVPGMARWGISEIIAACKEYAEVTGRRVTFEYCLLDGINDGYDQAYELAGILRPLNCHVNLIPYNHTETLDFLPSPAARAGVFGEILRKAGIRVTQRVQRGADIDAACGQLRRRVSDRR